MQFPFPCELMRFNCKIFKNILYGDFTSMEMNESFKWGRGNLHSPKWDFMFVFFRHKFYF